MIFFILSACSTTITTEYSTTVLEDQLSDSQYLRRLSLDIRGKLPSIEELERFDSTNPTPLIEEYLADEGFPNRIQAIYSEIYGTVTDSYFHTASDFLVTEDVLFRRSIGEEPLRILSHVAENDLPWSNIATADFTMANALLASIFPVEYDQNGEDWQAVPYTDGRPLSGVLSTNGLWWRYDSTNSNANRLRANAISKLLLCHDYLQKPISFDRENNLLDQDGLEDAIHNDPACVNCHSTLDPLAAHLFGFWSFQPQSWIEKTYYHPEREHLWAEYLGTSPQYYGQESENLTQLGQNIASDPRFANCAVEQIMSHFLQQDIDMADTQRIYPHREAFLESNLNMKDLVSSVAQDPDYRVGRKNNSAEGSNAKLIKLDQLVSSIEDLTGFRWKYGDYDMFGNDIIDLRSLAGGSDGRSASKSATVPNATLVLAQSILAEQAAVHVALEEIEQTESNRKFFIHTNLEGLLDDSAPEQIAYLYQLILSESVELDGEEVEAQLALWNAVFSATSNPTEAWVAVLTAILRDPNYLIY